MNKTSFKAEVRTDLEQVAVRLGRPVSQLERASLKCLHGFAVGASLLAKSVARRRQQHQKCFVRELAGDGVRLLHAACSGDARSTRLHLRRAQESALSHVYYRDHAIEFEWLLREVSRVEPAELRAYAKRMPQLHIHENLHERIANGYNLLSREAHTQSSIGGFVAQALDEIRPTEKTLLAAAENVRSIGRDIILLVWIVELERVARLHIDESGHLREFLDSKRRKELVKAEGQAAQP